MEIASSLSGVSVFFRNPLALLTERSVKSLEEFTRVHRNSVKPVTALPEILNCTLLGDIDAIDKQRLSGHEISLLTADPSQESCKTPLRILSVVDIDGVIVNPWKTLVSFLHDGNSGATGEISIGIFETLREINSKSDLVFWTSRFNRNIPYANPNGLDVFPWLSPTSQEWLRTQLNNGAVLTQIWTGKSNGSEYVSELLRSISMYDVVYYTGSSIRDRSMFRHLLEQAEPEGWRKLHFVDTQRLFL